MAGIEPISFTRLPDISYRYRHAPVPGGGFVTGFVFHPQEKNILYTRTDIGGVYRYNFEQKRWHSLMDHVTHMGKWETNPLSVAIDEQNPNRLYIIAGAGDKSFLCRSEDRGESFAYFPLPSGVHGNAPGRGTGERLLADNADSQKIYLGTQTGGFFVSADRGETWRKLKVQAAGGKKETNIAFVWLYPRTSADAAVRMVVSTSGQCNTPDGHTRGKSLYFSNDGGKSFQLMPGQPEPPREGNYPGYVGQRATFINGKLYITMASVIDSWRGFDGYACDMGGRQAGRVLCYDWPERSPEPAACQDVTPSVISGCGFGGICADPNNPGRIICSTQGADGDAVLLSTNGGKDWRIILRGTTIGRMNYTVPYMKPEYNGNDLLIHWLSDIKIDPFDSSRALFNTGTGIFMTENLDETAAGGESEWAPSCEGVEETVHLNIYSPTAGDKHLIDMIGDLGGFAFADLTKPAENSFADENGNRYITCLSADFPDDNPQLMIVTARGNWKDKTKGGLILSEDQCDTWVRLNDPTGVSDKIDRLIAAIRQPNTNSGWCCISPDEKTIIWCVGEGRILPIDCVVLTHDKGRTWEKSEVLSRPAGAQTLKVIADRVTPEIFYGFGNDSLCYISTDGGRHFNPVERPDDFPRLELGGMDGNMPAEIRAESGKHAVWIATGPGGLWRIDYGNPTRPVFQRISAAGDAVFRQGMGKPEQDGGCNTLYINGILNGEYGFWRSADEGKSFARINTEKQMFGDIRSMVGDPRVFGRVYIATGSRGVLWADPAE